jgi:hypothetical protein
VPGLDAYYVSLPPDDPVAGVIVSYVNVALLERRLTIELHYVRASGAMSRSEVLTLTEDEFTTFASIVYPKGGLGHEAVAALVQMKRLPNVTLDPPANSPL